MCMHTLKCAHNHRIELAEAACQPSVAGEKRRERHLQQTGQMGDESAGQDGGGIEGISSNNGSSARSGLMLMDEDSAFSNTGTGNSTSCVLGQIEEDVAKGGGEEEVEAVHGETEGGRVQRGRSRQV